MEQTKKCSKCGEMKGLEEFGKHSARKDGLDTRCKQCNRNAATAYRTANLELVRAKDRARIAAMTPEQKRAKHKRWRDSNLEHVRSVRRETARKLYAAKPDAYRALAKRWRDDNRELALAMNRASRINLSRGYVAMLLGMPASDAPQELIALKREQLAIKRMARELKKAATKPKLENPDESSTYPR